MQGQGEEGIIQILQGLAAYQVTGAELLRPFFLALLADAYGTAGQAEEGLAVLFEAQALADKIADESWWKAEISRLRGALLLMRSVPNEDEAEACFQQSLALAQNQQAKSLELRAATSLARLWQSQGKRQDAYDVLAPVYGWFTEGFDTADLKDAKALLEELAP